MNAEFALSNKIDNELIKVEDVREFIGDIKDILSGYGLYGILNMINTLAGDELK